MNNEELEKEIERLNRENNDLRTLYQRTYKHLYDIGKNELAGYFQAQINECPTFYVEPIIDYYEETKRLNKQNKNLKEDFKRHIDRINELTNRLDKAINYIEHAHFMNINYKDGLLKILEGSDEE